MTLPALVDPDTFTLAPSTADRINQAASAIRKYCGWHIAPSVTETRTLDGSGGLFQNLPTAYIAGIDDVASVTEDGVLLDAGTFEVSLNTCQLWRSWPWSGHFRGIVVELTHGYEALPDDVAGVLRGLANRMPDVTAGTAVMAEAADGVSRQYQSGAVISVAQLLPYELNVLEPYRIRNRP